MNRRTSGGDTAQVGQVLGVEVLEVPLTWNSPASHCSLVVACGRNIPDDEVAPDIKERLAPSPGPL